MQADDSQAYVVTNKDDDDPILEYKNIETGHLAIDPAWVGRIPFLKATNSELVAHSLHKIEEMRGKGARQSPQSAQIILPFDPYRYSWLRLRKIPKKVAQSSFINLPDGAGMLWLSKMQYQPLPELVSVIRYSLSLIRLAQAMNYTIFFVGSRDEVLEKLMVNLRRSFPTLRIVGRHSGKLKGANRERVFEALRKTEPHIIFLGLGYDNGVRWIHDHRDKLSNCLIINMAGALDILAGVRKKAPDSVATNGYTWLWRVFNRPWRWHRIFLVFYMLIETIWLRLFRDPDDLKGTEPAAKVKKQKTKAS